MAQKTSETNHAKLIIQIVCVLALVALSGIRAVVPDFQVDTIVYAIIAGVLFGVGGVRELFGAGSSSHSGHNDKKRQDRHEDN